MFLLDFLLKMFKTIVKKYYFPVFIITGLLVYLLQRYNADIPTLINNYLNDFLCMPIVLKIGLFSIRYIKSDEHIVLPLPLQIITTFLFIIYFEVVLPSYNERYTADILDVAAYSLGLILFIGIEGFQKDNFSADN
ncbi:hypothetical protein CLV90_0314 [Maribacter spongiicola]|uniref:Magnesium citrate secondary transporter n=2 Tax=Maribacter spongiicola TaxID=1206753 RepID=A0A4R7K783_9FLAO|nr:hypothetical protein CLV90_0314 [Maribacter spongiicola]